MWAKNRNTVLGLAAGVTEVPVGIPGRRNDGGARRLSRGLDHRAGFRPLRPRRRARRRNRPGLDGLPRPAERVRCTSTRLDSPSSADSATCFGSSQPDWSGAITGSVTFWQKLQLSFLVDVRHGSQAYNGTRGGLYAYGTHRDTEIRGQLRTFGMDFHPGPVVGPGAGTPVVIDESWFAGRWRCVRQQYGRLRRGRRIHEAP